MIIESQSLDGHRKLQRSGSAGRRHTPKAWLTSAGRDCYWRRQRPVPDVCIDDEERDRAADQVSTDSVRLPARTEIGACNCSGAEAELLSAPPFRHPDLLPDLAVPIFLQATQSRTPMHCAPPLAPNLLYKSVDACVHAASAVSSNNYNPCGWLIVVWPRSDPVKLVGELGQNRGLPAREGSNECSGHREHMPVFMGSHIKQALIERMEVRR
jgi:hypothetical protein